jgi:RimJ/RimL family protein N-acetyltransferase
MTTILETERLLVRPWETGDVDDAFAILGDLDVTRYLGETGEAFADRERVREWLHRIADKSAGWGKCGSWAAVEKVTNTVIGGGGLLELEGGPDVEVFYHFRKASWGHGYATELTRGLIDYAFVALHLPHVVGVAYPANTASHQVMSKAGMTHLGLRHAYGTDMEYFEITQPSPTADS